MTLPDTLPLDASANLSLHPTSPAPPILLMKVVRTPAVQQGLFEDMRPAPAAASAIAAVTHFADDPATPSFTRFARRANRPLQRVRWGAACALLLLCLGAQLAWAQRDALTADARTGPWLRRVCQTLHCSLPAVADPAQLQLLSRDVRPHPSVPDALLISLALRNDAAFSQPYPVVSITLSDLDDNRIAMRRFKPSEYINDATVRRAGLQPGANAALVFEVHDPGKNAVAFKFGFQ